MAISVQPLDRQHDVKSFNCGTEVLNEWLQRTARQHQEKNISRTYVIVDDGDPGNIYGFYAIAICEVAVTDIPPEMARRLPRAVPGMRLGRLATDLKYQGNRELRIGETLLIDAMIRAKQLSKQIGGYALFIDAKDESATRFYVKYGFVPLRDNPLKLLMTMASIPG